MTLADC